MSYNKYPKEMKDAVVARLLSGEETMADINRETGININTLYRWRDAANKTGLSATTKYKNADKWSSQDKFTVVLETANLTEIEFSEYCRNKGIYPEQVKEWKERIPYALEVIATQKIDRNDIITHFPIIWGKMEAYLKKLVYLIDPVRYDEIKKTPKSSIINFFNELGFPVFVEKANRTNESDAIFTAYNIRNGDAHECEKWSLRSCYNYLAKTMASYILVTAAALPRIKGSLNNKSIPKYQLIGDINIIRCIDCIHREGLYNLNEMRNIKTITDRGNNTFFSKQFDSKGYLIGSSFERDDYKSKDEFKYVEENGLIKKRLRIHKSTDNFASVEDAYWMYSYNTENQIEKISYFCLDSRTKQYEKKKQYEIEYLTDGGLKILMQDYCWYKEEATIRNSYILIYDNAGRIIEISYPDKHKVVQFTYDEKGGLIRINHPDNTYIEIVNVQNNKLFLKKKYNQEGEFVEQKRSYVDDKMISMKHYVEQIDNEQNAISKITVDREYSYYK